MSDLPAQRASDAEREHTIALLRDHTADGRLTLEEFTDRMSTAYLARTNTELDQLVQDLSAAPARTGSRRRPTRFLLSVLFGHARTNGNDPPPTPGTPIVHVYVVAAFAGIDAWRVPIAWTRKTLGEVIRAIDSGAHRELEP